MLPTQRSHRKTRHRQVDIQTNALSLKIKPDVNFLVYVLRLNGGWFPEIRHDTVVHVRASPTSRGMITRNEQRCLRVAFGAQAYDLVKHRHQTIFL